MRMTTILLCQNIRTMLSFFTDFVLNSKVDVDDDYPKFKILRSVLTSLQEMIFST